MFLGAVNRDRAARSSLTNTTLRAVHRACRLWQRHPSMRRPAAGAAGRRMRALSARPQGRGDPDHRPAASALQRHIACIGQPPGDGMARVATIRSAVMKMLAGTRLALWEAALIKRVGNDVLRVGPQPQIVRRSTSTGSTSSIARQGRRPDGGHAAGVGRVQPAVTSARRRRVALARHPPCGFP